MTEEHVIQSLTGAHRELDGKVIIQRKRRICADVDIRDISGVLRFAANDLGFTFLCTITGLDEGAVFSFIYHLARSDGIMLNIKTHVGREELKIRTVMDLFPNAEIYERELVDLFGIQVEGLPPGLRYPLPDDWPQGEYPLRKDWKEGSSNA